MTTINSSINLLTRQYITNPENNEIEFDSGEIPSKSFVFAFMRGLEACFIRVDLTAPVAVTSANEALILWGNPIGHWASIPGNAIFHINAPVNETRFGIVVGSGTTVITTTDNRLHTQILHGTAAGQLEHREMIVRPTTAFADRIDIRLERIFRNNVTPAANVIIRECGIYTQGGHGGNFHMIVRDLISPEITLLPGRFLTIEYIIRTLL